MRFKRSDIVVTLPPYRAEVLVVMSVDTSKPKNVYDCRSPETGKCFSVPDEAVKKIGVATEEFMTGDVVIVPPQEFQAGRRRATYEAAQSQFLSKDNYERWQKLADSKTGDLIKIRLNGKEETLTFSHVLSRGQKFVFLATNEEGKTFKYPLRVILPNG